jgi:hypothetical protein
MLLIGLCLGVTFGIAFIPIFEDSDCDSMQMQSGAVLSKPLPPPMSPLFHLSNVVNPRAMRNPVPVPGGIPDTGTNKVDDKAAIDVDKPGAPIVEKKKTSVRFSRPRYASFELGLRKKVIVGIVLSDSAHIDKLLQINQTLARFVDKVIFFINGSDAELLNKLKVHKLSGVIPIAVRKNLSENSGNMSRDAKNRHLYNHLALQGIKYFGEKLRMSYDFFHLTLDNYYVNGRLLTKVLKKISVREDALWGNPGRGKGTSCKLGKLQLSSVTIIKLIKTF